MSIENSLADRVALLARGAGSLRRLDKASGLKLGHSQQIARGNITSVQVDTVDKLARATGATLAWLIRGEGRAPDVESVRALVQDALGTDADEAAVEVLHDVEAAPARGAA